MLRKKVGLLPVKYHKIESFYKTWFSDIPEVTFIDNDNDLYNFIKISTIPNIDLKELFLLKAKPAIEKFLKRAIRS